MKGKHVEAYRVDAVALLESWGFGRRVPDFHELTSAQVERVEEAADVRRYQKPRNANGSRARYFYAMTVRRAARQGDRG